MTRFEWWMFDDLTQLLKIDEVIDLKRGGENTVNLFVRDCEVGVASSNLGLRRRNVQPLGLLFSPLLLGRSSLGSLDSCSLCLANGLLSLPLSSCLGTCRLPLCLFSSLRFLLHLPIELC